MSIRLVPLFCDDESLRFMWCGIDKRKRTVDFNSNAVDSGVNLRICGFEALEMWP